MFLSALPTNFHSKVLALAKALRHPAHESWENTSLSTCFDANACFFLTFIYFVTISLRVSDVCVLVFERGSPSLPLFCAFCFVKFGGHMSGAQHKHLRIWIRKKGKFHIHSDNTHYTVACFMTHDSSRKLRKKQYTSASRVWFNQ